MNTNDARILTEFLRLTARINADVRTAIDAADADTNLAPDNLARHMDGIARLGVVAADMAASLRRFDATLAAASVDRCAYCGWLAVDYYRAQDMYLCHDHAPRAPREYTAAGLAQVGTQDGRRRP